MFGLGKKKGADEPDAPAPEQGGGALSSNRARVGLLALVLIAGAGYLAYEYLPDLLDGTPPPVPMQAKAKPRPAPVVVAKAPAPQPVAVAPKPEARPAEEEAKPAPEPVAKPKPEPAPMEPKAEPIAKAEPMAKAEPAAKAEPMVTPMLMAKSDPPAQPEPMAKPAETMAKPAEPMAKPEAQPVAPVLGPPPITPKYNDVMTAVLYGDRAAVAQLLDLGRWVDKPDSNGLTPLMAAVLMRDADMVQLLLDRGADPNLQAPGGEVALEMARRNGDGASESQLLRAGAKY